MFVKTVCMLGPLERRSLLLLINVMYMLLNVLMVEKQLSVSGKHFPLSLVVLLISLAFTAGSAVVSQL